MLNLFTIELNRELSEDELTKINNLVEQYGTDKVLSAFVKAVYNNIRNLDAVEKILTNPEIQLLDKKINVEEILNHSSNRVDLEIKIENKFQRKLSLLEKYLIHSLLNDYSDTEIIEALENKIIDVSTVHRLVEILNIRKEN